MSDAKAPAHADATRPQISQAGGTAPSENGSCLTRTSISTDYGQNASQRPLVDQAAVAEAPLEAYGAAHEKHDLESGVMKSCTRLSSTETPPVGDGGDSHCNEKGGSRTDEEEPDPDYEPPMTFKRMMIFVAMGFLWTASQIPLFLFGGVFTIIESEIGGGDRYVWSLLASLIPLATVTPFVGPLSDLIGRRNIAIVSCVSLIIGNIICSTAHTMNNFIGGQTFIGIGAGIAELTALSVAGESAPTHKRGWYVGGIIATIIPYCPAVLYGQLVAAHGSWRFIGLWCGLWSLVAAALTAIFYWPPPRPNSAGLSKMDILKRIDYIGGVLMAGGVTLFLAGLTWGGNQYSWTSSHVMVTLILGAVLIIAFGIWEIWFVKYPMFPGRLKENPRILAVIMIITFVSGANFFAVLVFWPTQFYYMYTGATLHPNPIQVGIGSLPVGFCIFGGAIIFSVLISLFKGRIKLLMIVSTVIMTAGNGAMAAARVDNLNAIYAALTFACLGVGSVIIPNQIIASIICPDDLIATATALTISVRILGGAIGYAAYYHVLRSNFTTKAVEIIVPAIAQAGVYEPKEYYNIIIALVNNQRYQLPHFKFLESPEAQMRVLVAAQETWAASFSDVYYISIAFGGVAIIASVFMPSIERFMDRRIAVQYL